MGVKTLAVLLVVACFAASAHAACPDLSFNKSCNTGSCASGGLSGGWVIPKIPNVPCPDLPCKYQGTFIVGGQTIDSFTGVKSSSACCSKCKSKTKCNFWQQIDGVCFLYYGSGPKCGASQISKAGGKCKAEIKDDPHLVGAHGTHYDFSGLPDKTFCLVTDRELHINMKMTGYLDERLESASIIQDGKAVRTWIREVGILWVAQGVQHKMRMVARSGKETARGEGYLELVEVDGVALPRMQPGDVSRTAGGFVLWNVAIEKKGPFEVDYYRLRIMDVLDMDIRLRVANPLLQRPDDAETHISLGISTVKQSEAIHGVLGQTYREGREERTMRFTKINSLLHQSIAADGETGKGFLDGDATLDYVSSDVLAADCKYTAFNGHVLPTEIVSE